MATPSSTNPDTLISLKVNYDGVIKKLRMPIRDLGASSIENKLGTALLIPTGTACRFERYSDSAASYVVLDTSNSSVFKQLYRAAKAKQKLKLRVTTLGPKDTVVTQEPKASPKAVTIEEVPEGAEPQEMNKANKSEETLVPVPEVAAPFTPAFLAPQLSPFDAYQAVLNAEANKAAPTAPLVDISPIPSRSVESRPESPVKEVGSRPSFAVCCNSCERTIPNVHYHCGTCDDGDFDLCLECITMGITCYGSDHWMIKRFVKDNALVNSHTERLPPKPITIKKPAPAPQVTCQVRAPPVVPVFDFSTVEVQQVNVRTCNNCVRELPEDQFVHCTTCYDFDLCKLCFTKNDHGHHPKHGFIPAEKGTIFDYLTRQRLSPGRNEQHNAICDGCDKFISGIRHKCLDCPDWDYCSSCVENSGFVHPGHRFVPIYEAIKEVPRVRNEPRVYHTGISCDGPLCNGNNGKLTHISGDRYKCAVCDDTDFCANCEASPANTHNKTHPLIKFKTPIRHVSVTTTGEHENGRRMPPMGDRHRRAFSSSSSQEACATMPNKIAINPAKTVVAVMPSEPATPVKAEEPAPAEPTVEVKSETVEPVEAVAAAPSVENLFAVYESDTIADGTVLPPNHVFQQTWVLRNAGTVSWPAGCSVKFVGGDYMGHVDPNRPAGIRELVSASESTICYNELKPGESFPFTVLLRTPSRFGKSISFWRLTTQNGDKFGHRVWCDVTVEAPEPKAEPVPVKEEVEETPLIKEETQSIKSEESQMIFPKLEKESPVASLHQDAQPEAYIKHDDEFDEFEASEDDEWAEEDDFLTDEEYDILDASDEEYLEEQQKKLLKK